MDVGEDLFRRVAEGQIRRSNDRAIRHPEERLGVRRIGFLSLHRRWAGEGPRQGLSG